MIITLFPLTINDHDIKTLIKDWQTALDAMAAKLGIFRFREYRVILGYKEHILRVPLATEKGTKALLWPAGLLPRRHYPLAVYLCAVGIYITGRLSMRDVALLIRKMFGLDQFSHSTICRAKKKLLLLLASTPSVDSSEPSASDALSLLQRLRGLLKDIPKNPFLHAERLAVHHFQTYQVLLL